MFLRDTQRRIEHDSAGAMVTGARRALPRFSWLHKTVLRLASSRGASARHRRTNAPAVTFDSLGGRRLCTVAKYTICCQQACLQQ